MRMLENQSILNISDALRDLVPFIQFKKRGSTYGEVLPLVKLQAEATLEQLNFGALSV